MTTRTFVESKGNTWEWEETPALIWAEEPTRLTDKPTLTAGRIP